ncbi:hypothetical protein BCV69DRAFT_312259 [Microstroma glucosiphilum]|uniref:Dolichyl-diphosphooligosaccharide--protein glycosyltransferase subunit 4 n=1 Tax=Pseudomicrostroma glucosiphilum TaxID=1684307 RepID=A0A316U715_9BASI|nr:hypothetical protein BCV69DRAFT_312259 [Pseudomicrostroma glucosiphilum]PWN20982.1 hypothetical protein BCV69DRAFT_312259 [Pseudomicrostroma glucosiphilum]
MADIQHRSLILMCFRHPADLSPSPLVHALSMITDVQLSALANWLGSLTMVLIVVYHAVGANAKRTDKTTARAMAGEEEVSD